MPRRFWLAVLLGLLACAPAVPRPARKPLEPDASAVDLPAATGEMTIDARMDSRAPGSATADARGDATDARGDAAMDARGDAAMDARGDAAMDARADAPNDARGDAATDARAEAPVDARADAPVDARADADGDDHADADAHDTVDAGAGTDARADEPPAPDGPIVVAPRAGDLAIDEILINPAGTDTSREWIEVVNRSPFALDLSLLHVADAANDVAVGAGVMAPGGSSCSGSRWTPARTAARRSRSRSPTSSR